jgi:hypothetical protein
MLNWLIVGILMWGLRENKQAPTLYAKYNLSISLGNVKGTHWLAVQQDTIAWTYKTKEGSIPCISYERKWYRNKPDELFERTTDGQYEPFGYLFFPSTFHTTYLGDTIIENIACKNYQVVESYGSVFDTTWLSVLPEVSWNVSRQVKWFYTYGIDGLPIEIKTSTPAYYFSKRIYTHLKIASLAIQGVPLVPAGLK